LRWEAPAVVSTPVYRHSHGRDLHEGGRGEPQRHRDTEACLTRHMALLVEGRTAKNE
jgi:hypothetical protein